MSARATTLVIALGLMSPSACHDEVRTAGQGHDAVVAHHPERGHGDERVVHISPSAIARSGIRVAQVQQIPAAFGIDVPAEVHAEPDRLAHVSSVVSGQIARVEASMGDRVQVGQTLAILRSVALGQARAETARSRANVEVAEANFRRQQELQREGIGAERQFLEARAELRRAQAERSAAERALEVYGRAGSGSEVAIKSPIAGTISARHATVGEVIGASDILFEITDISRVWVVGRVYQQHAGQVHEGSAAVLSLQAYPGRTFAGTLDYVAPALDEHTRTLPVRVVLDNPDKLLRPGLFGTLSIRPESDKRGPEQSVAAVLASALQRLGEQTVVFIPDGQEGAFRAVSVVPLAHSGDLVPIEDGLAAGDRYVADGAFVLKSELSRSQLGEGHNH